MEQYDTIDKIKKFIVSEEVSTFYESLKELAQKKAYRCYNYIGINHEKEKEDIKFYFTFFDKIEPDKISRLHILPRIDEYERFMEFYTSDTNISWQHTGIAFSIKLNALDKIRTGFHLRGKDFSKSRFYSPPKNVVLTELDLQNYQGICFEYEDDRIFRKNYYYISDEKTKQQLTYKFENDDILKAEIIEYTESELGNKVILWYNLNEKRLIPNVHSAIDKSLIHTIGLQTGFNGFYEHNEKKSIYYNAPYVIKNGLITFDTYSYLHSFIKG